MPSTFWHFFQLSPCARRTRCKVVRLSLSKAACVADDLFKPASQFLQQPALNLIQGPGMARQAVVERVSLDDRVGELVELLLVKRGERPPV